MSNILAEPSENYQAGWVKLYRSIKKHWIWEDPHRLRFWISILLDVNHSDKKVLISGTLITCNRGQSVKSLKTWAAENRCSVQVVRTFFKLLQQDRMIKLENVKKSTRLTVCNYVSYNDSQHSANTLLTRDQHAANTQLTTNKNVKNVKKGQKPYFEKNNFPLAPPLTVLKSNQ